jgi:hypothetical protein
MIRSNKTFNVVGNSLDLVGLHSARRAFEYKRPPRGRPVNLVEGENLVGSSLKGTLVGADASHPTNPSHAAHFCVELHGVGTE